MSSPLIGSLSVSLSSSEIQPPAKRPRILGAGDLEPEILDLLNETSLAALPVDWEGGFGLDRADVVAELVRLCSSLLGEDEQVLVTTWSIFTRFMYRIQVDHRTNAPAPLQEELPEAQPHGEISVSVTQLRCLLYLAMAFAVDCVSSLEEEDQIGSFNEWAALYVLIESGEDYLDALAKIELFLDSHPRDVNGRQAQMATFLSAMNKFAIVLDWRIRSPTCWEYLIVFTDELRLLSLSSSSSLNIESIVQSAFEYLVPCSFLLSEVHSPASTAAIALLSALRSQTPEGLESRPRPLSTSASKDEASMQGVEGGGGDCCVSILGESIGFEDLESVRRVARDEETAINGLKGDVEELIKKHCRSIIARLYV